MRVQGSNSHSYTFIESVVVSSPHIGGLPAANNGSVMHVAARRQNVYLLAVGSHFHDPSGGLSAAVTGNTDKISNLPCNGSGVWCAAHGLPQKRGKHSNTGADRVSCNSGEVAGKAFAKVQIKPPRILNRYEAHRRPLTGRVWINKSQPRQTCRAFPHSESNT